MSPTTIYGIALVVGILLFVFARVASWLELRRARRTHQEPRIGRLALAIFFLPFGGVGVIVGFAGLMQTQR